MTATIPVPEARRAPAPGAPAGDGGARPGAGGRRWALAAGWALAAASLAAPAARAELAILADGRVLKAASFRVDGSRVRLDLPGGGHLVLPLARVERLVADEVVPEPEPLPRPAFALGFEEGHRRPATPYGDLIFEAARRNAVNPALLAAMVRAESAFDPWAISDRGAQGLLQLMPATAARFGVEAADLFDPARNLEAGARYVRWLAARFGGDLARVLAAYNAGEGIVERFSGVPPFRETRNYVARVFDLLGLAGTSGAGAVPAASSG